MASKNHPKTKKKKIKSSSVSAKKKLNETTVNSSKKSFNPDSSYELNTEDIKRSGSEFIDSVSDKISIGKAKADKKKKQKKRIEDLGLHEDFNPDSKYSITSREVAIKTWKDFFLVYFVMALSIFAFISILVSYGYLINPFVLYSDETVALDFQYVSNPTEEGAYVGSNDDINYEAEKFLTVDVPIDNSIQASPIYVEGTATALYESVEVLVYDNHDNKIAHTTAKLFGSNSDIRQWITIMNVARSPKTSSGYITSYPTSENKDSDQAAFVPFEFHTFKNESIHIIAPIENQLSNGDKVGVFIDQIDSSVASIMVTLLTDKDEILLDEELLFIDGEIREFVSVPEVSGVESTMGTWRFEYGDKVVEIPMKFQDISLFE